MDNRIRYKFLQHVMNHLHIQDIFHGELFLKIMVYLLESHNQSPLNVWFRSFLFPICFFSKPIHFDMETPKPRPATTKHIQNGIRPIIIGKKTMLQDIIIPA